MSKNIVKSPKAMTVATLVVATREVKGVHPAERRTTPPDNGGVRFTAARRGDGFEAAWLGPTEIDRNMYTYTLHLCKILSVSSI